MIKNGQEHMERVREALNEGYCDISNQVGDLTQLGMFGEYRSTTWLMFNFVTGTISSFRVYATPGRQRWLGDGRSVYLRFVRCS